MTTLVVACHGIGNHDENFHEAWEEKFKEIHPQGRFEVTGLHWDDLQDRIQAKYPLLSPEAADLVDKLGTGALKDVRDSDGYELMREFVLDVLVYCGLSEMRSYVLTACGLRLMRETKNRYKNTVLVGHSLGCALLTHLTQLEQIHLGAIAYRGMILCAPPFGIESPLRVVRDPLSVTPTVRGEDAAGSRSDILKEIALNWRIGGEGRLRLILNTNDTVCSHVEFDLAGEDRDVLPFVRTGLNDRERAALRRADLVEVTFGTNKLGDIGANHDALAYFSQPEFATAFKELVG